MGLLLSFAVHAQTNAQNQPEAPAGLSEEEVAAEAMRVKEEFRKSRSEKDLSQVPEASESRALDLSHWGPLHPLSGTDSVWSSVRSDGEADFLAMRGVDAGQGREIAISVDGIPLNLPNHIRSQGYADLHFIIPELVERVEIARGSVLPSKGDFASVGSVDVSFRQFLPANLALLGSGMDNTLRGLAIASVGGDWRPLIAADFYTTSGPYQNGEGLKRYNLFTRLTHSLDSHGTELSLTFMGHSSDWNASGYVPERALANGKIDPLGSLDPSQGGSSRRYSGVAKFTTMTARDQTLTLSGYATRSEFSIFSNESYFALNHVDGDEREGTDERTILGLNGTYRIDQRKSEIGFDTILGVQLRGDFISRSVDADKSRVRLSVLQNDNIQSKNAAAYASQEISWTKWLKSIAAIRGELLAYNLDGQTNIATHALSVTGNQSVVVAAPKTGIVINPTKNIDVYVRTGLSYHTNDAKAVLLSADSNNYLTSIAGYELGVRGTSDRFTWEVTGFSLAIGKEIDFDPLYETSVLVGASSRLGVEARTDYRILNWLSVEGTATLTKARLNDAPTSSNAVPFAPTMVASAAVVARHPDGYFGRLGLTHIGDRPATSDRSLVADGFLRVDAMLGYRAKAFEFTLAAINLFNTQWQELQTVGISRLGGEVSAIQDVNFVAGTPLNIQATASIFF